MPDNALPDIRARVTLDDSQLSKGGVTAGKTGAAIEAGMAKGKVSLGQFSGALQGVMGAAGLGGMPVAALKSGEALEGMSKTGISGMTLLGGAAIAGAGIMATVLGESISKYVALADQVENYKRVTGASAEESGRMVQTFQALGVGEDTATAGMFKLSKAIETAPKKLTDLGVVIAHTANGSVDLSKTLFSVADAYNATLDPAKRNLIVFDAFGKSGKDMIPILEQGSAQLRQMEDAAHITFSEEDLQRAKDYKIQLAELNQGWNSIWESLGQKVVPGLDDVMTRMDRSTYIGKELEKMLNAGTLSWGDFQKATLGSTTAGNGIVVTLGNQYDAGHKLKTGLDQQVQATNDATAADVALAAQTNLLIKDDDAQMKASDGLANAIDGIKEAQWKVTDAQAKYNADVKAYGANSRQAQQDLIDVNRALRDQKDALLAAGDAAQRKAAADATASGATDGATKGAQAYVLQLEREALTLKPGSSLRKWLDGYIDTLGRIPLHVTTKITADYQQTAKGPKALAGGGRPDLGIPNIVGEKGPEIFVPDRPGTIIPHGQTPAANGGGGTTYNVSVQVLGSVRTERELVGAIREGIRRADREQR
jgi:hypothetical protein